MLIVSQEWDAVRKQRVGELDTVLESLGKQLVPAGFYSLSPESSLFGSQHGSDDEQEDEGVNGSQPAHSPTETLRDVLRNGMKDFKMRQRDRSTWKTLRDFVDERAIEDMLDTIESDRNALDVSRPMVPLSSVSTRDVQDILARTSDYPESLNGTIAAIRSSLPTEISIPPMDSIFHRQEQASIDMANYLSSLTDHYEQMVQALHDNEAGEEFSEADLQGTSYSHGRSVSAHTAC